MASQPTEMSKRVHYKISSAWQAELTNSVVFGEVASLWINGYLANRLGYRCTMVAALIWLSIAIFLSFFTSSLEILLVAQLLCGMLPS